MQRVKAKKIYVCECPICGTEEELEDADFYDGTKNTFEADVKCCDELFIAYIEREKNENK